MRKEKNKKKCRNCQILLLPLRSMKQLFSMLFIVVAMILTSQVQGFTKVQSDVVTFDIEHSYQTSIGDIETKFDFGKVDVPIFTDTNTNIINPGNTKINSFAIIDYGLKTYNINNKHSFEFGNTIRETRIKTNLSLSSVKNTNRFSYKN